MSIETIITELATLQAEIPGINKAWDKTPESLNSFPCFVNIPASGDIKRLANQRQARHVVKMQLRVLRADSLSAETKVRPFLELVLDKFDAHISLNGKAVYSQIIHYDYGNLSWGSADYLGISFDIAVTEITS
jgi:hypothetical protein